MWGGRHWMGVSVGGCVGVSVVGEVDGYRLHDK